MTFFRNLLASQFRKPRGLLGSIVANKMARFNAEPYSLIIDALEFCGEERVLEVGFGPGLGVAHIARIVENKTGSVCGIDVSKTMLKRASRQNRTFIEKKIVSLSNQSAARTEFEDNQFDVLFGVNVVYFFDDPKRCLTELKRILRPQGRAAFYLTDRHSLDIKSELFTKYTGEEFAQVMTQCGFQNTKLYTHHITSDNRPRTGHVIIGWKP